MQRFEHRDPAFTYSAASPGLGDRVRRAQGVARGLWAGFVVLALLCSVPLAAMIRNEIKYEQLTRGSVIDRRDYVKVVGPIRLPQENRPWMIALIGLATPALGLLCLSLMARWRGRRLRRSRSTVTVARLKSPDPARALPRYEGQTGEPAVDSASARVVETKSS